MRGRRFTPAALFCAIFIIKFDKYCKELPMNFVLAIFEQEKDRKTAKKFRFFHFFY